MDKVKRSTILPVLLAGGFAAGAYYLLSLARAGQNGLGDHLFAILLAIVAAGISFMSVMRFNKTMNDAASELNTMADNGEIGLVEVKDHNDAMQRIIKPVNRLLSRCETDLNDARQLNRKQQIQLRLDEAEKKVNAAVINSLSDSVIVTDNFDEIKLVNIAAGRLYGFDTAKALHKPISEIIGDDEIAELISQTRTKSNSDRIKCLERKFKTGDGERQLRFSFKKIECDNDMASGVLTIIRDVTKEHDVDIMKSDFVSGVSHELRSPLSGIRAYVEMLNDGEVADEAQQKEFYGIILSQVERLDRLIDNILNISRIEAGVIKVSPEILDITSVVKSIKAIAVASAAEKNILVEEKLSPVFLQVNADRDMISQAVMNLVSNAVKYTPEGGCVTISTSADQDESVVRVSVADTGVGISEEDLPKLFDKFYRVEGSKNMAKGAGLGLNLVLNIVENLHGGRLCVSSELGKGSVFTIELPAV